MNKTKTLAVFLFAVMFLAVPVYAANVRYTFQVTVSDTATLILPASSGQSRAVIILSNNGSYIVYIGNSTVTNSSGYALQPRGTIGSTLILTKAMGFDMESAIYGIVIAGRSCVVFVIEEFNP